MSWRHEDCRWNTHITHWRIAYHPNNPAVVELRRAEGRGRAWDSEPGEYYHSFSGEYGGLWRLLGRPPNRLVGVGFVALAQDDSTAFLRQPAADDPQARFVFEGTTEGSVFGAYGSMCGGAVLSTGSIGFAGSLAYNNYVNDIGRIATNVLDRFLNPEPFPYPNSN